MISKRLSEGLLLQQGCQSLTGYQRVQHRHSHRDPMGDLIQNDTASSIIRHIGIDFKTAIHRPRVHDDRTFTELCCACPRQCETSAVIIRRCNCAAGISFKLNSQHHDRINFRQHRIEIMIDLYRSRAAGRKLRESAREKCDGTDEDDVRAERGQAVHRGSRNAAVRDVPDDRDSTACERTERAPKRQQIKQSLRGMFVSSIARVENGQINLARELERLARCARTNDERINPHGPEIQRSIE